MFDFEFQNPTKILFGKHQIATIGREIPSNARILITYGGGSVIENGVLNEVKAALLGRPCLEFGGIEPNPTYETLMQAVELVKKEQINFLLAVGGGSVIDGTKFIAAAACWELGDPWDILVHGGKGIQRALPLATVLTLPATGSEMNCGAVISRTSRQVNLPAGGSMVNAGVASMITQSTNEKLVFVHPSVYPRFSVLDPTTTYSLPQRQIANGVVDAFVHVMEQYLTYPVQAKVQDRFAEALLLTLIEEGPKAFAKPQDYDVRANIMWSATMALNGLIGAGVPQDWTSHQIGHELTALHGLDHARTLAILLPAVMEVRRADKHDKLLQYAARIWGLVDGEAEQRIDQAIQYTRDFFEALGVPTRLNAYQITAEAFPEVLRKLEEHGQTAMGERQSVTLEVSRQILEASL